MRILPTLVFLLALGSTWSIADAQFGGGFSPRKPAPASPPEAPPTAPTQVAPEAEPEAEPEGNPPTLPENAPQFDEPTSAKPSSPPDSGATVKVAKPVKCDAPQKAWIARLDPEDREAIDAGLGYALAELSPTLKWVGSTSTQGAPDFKGKVVVIQSIDAGSSTPAILDRIVTGLGSAHSDGDVVVIGVQIPSKLDLATKRLEKTSTKAIICIDTDGKWCDALGIYKKPVNLIVDRNGAIRFAGLTEKGSAAAAKSLVAEPKAEIRVAARPESVASASAPTVSFPTFTEPLSGCKDFRGRMSPELMVDQWITVTPNTKGKVIIVDFFFTGCAPCRAAIPHTNELVKVYGDSVAVVGVSFESKSTFDSGMKKHKLKTSDFHYPLGLDTTRRTIGAFGVESYPSIAILSADGIVRWQGHPSNLNRAVLDPIVAANGALAKSAEQSKSRSWAK